MTRPTSLAAMLLAVLPLIAAADDVVYTPTDAAAAKMSVGEAKAVIATLTKDYWIVPAWWGNPKTRVTAVKVDEEAIVIEYNDRRRERRDTTTKITLKLDQMPKIEVMKEPNWGVYFDRDKETALSILPPSRAGMEKFVAMANAMHALKLFAVEAKRQDADFVRAAAEYRTAAPKPTLNEDGRKLKVQAEFMIREKKFPEAAALYAEALKGAPWWADGHYNRALVLAELKQYPQAVRQMKRYLLLEPDAPNARAVQDQIYQWEAAAR